MVTIVKMGGHVATKVAEIYGLSTDSKPIGDEIPNASIYYSMDDQMVYLYDAENKRWIEQ